MSYTAPPIQTAALPRLLYEIARHYWPEAVWSTNGWPWHCHPGYYRGRKLWITRQFHVCLFTTITLNLCFLKARWNISTINIWELSAHSVLDFFSMTVTIFGFKTFSDVLTGQKKILHPFSMKKLRIRRRQVTISSMSSTSDRCHSISWSVRETFNSFLALARERISSTTIYLMGKRWWNKNSLTSLHLPSPSLFCHFPSLPPFLSLWYKTLLQGNGPAEGVTSWTP